MADQTTHVVEGSVPPDKWKEFFRANFVLKNGRPFPVELYECEPCPQTLGNQKLHHCEVIIHADGGAELHCIYK
jgi:hypothetical protein